VEELKNMSLKECVHLAVKYTVIKRKVSQKKPYETLVSKTDKFLVEGMNLMWELICGAGGNAYNNANARIGVGDSSAAEDETQTGLQAATNKFWKAMAATYPLHNVDKKITFRSVFINGEAEFAWNEVTIVNAADDTGQNMLRIVSAKGTKPAGEEWTAEIECTFANP
jgi:hypothetical protein